ncbi:dihydroorotate dehydrogenase [Alkalibaculum sp. M08DMB]|uniref:Dihydroorotate dehydrogenase n=1 Tax=Alkalibaculum sporogenes TaxID=2655001 RepID=A0A6A7K6W6_9FIRM|nr:undecaprenyl diphosphate synthase family protein [Alkalibaculum sporogenes]MPW25092.1 dihydroorotate dehydrogenase [Alkalibaculum sporogenes]
MRLPEHLGIIPDGNRRWAQDRGMSKEQGYDKGINPGLSLFYTCKELGIKELTYYGFTKDNTKRPTVQRLAFTKACIDAVKLLSKEDASLLVIGNTSSAVFPKELLPYTKRQTFGNGSIKVNFLVNYSWEWDISSICECNDTKPDLYKNIHSSDISRIDLILRWGGRRRLSGFLPIQSVYSDFYIIDEYWPDYKESHIHDALNWYNKQDITLGG